MESFAWQLEASQDFAGDLKKAGDAFVGSLRRGFQTIAGPFVQSFTKFLDGTYMTEVLKANDQMNRLALTMGKSGKEVIQMQNSVYEIQKDLGVNTETAQKMATALISSRVTTEDLVKIGSRMTQFAEMTGISVENSAKFAGNFMKLKNASVSSLNSITKSMVQVQKGMGLTSEGMESAVETTSELITKMTVMGATTSQITKMAVEVTKLSATFEKAGLSADRAGSYMKNMMDVNKFEDNIAFMQKMGVSAQDYADILSGNATLQVDMNKELEKLGEEVYNLMKTSPIAAREYAKIFGGGMSAEELLKIRGSKQEGKKKNQEWESMYGESLDTVNRNLSKVQNQFDGFLKSLLSRFVPVIKTVIEILLKVMKKIDWQALGDKITGIVEKFVSIFQKFVSIFQSGDWKKGIIEGAKSVFVGMKKELAPMLEDFFKKIKFEVIKFWIFTLKPFFNQVVDYIRVKVIDPLMKKLKEVIKPIVIALSSLTFAIGTLLLPILVPILATMFVFDKLSKAIGGNTEALKKQTKKYEDDSRKLKVMGSEMRGKVSENTSSIQMTGQMGLDSLSTALQGILDKGKTEKWSEEKIVEAANFEKDKMLKAYNENTKATIWNTNEIIRNTKQQIDKMVQESDLSASAKENIKSFDSSINQMKNEMKTLSGEEKTTKENEIKARYDAEIKKYKELSLTSEKDRKNGLKGLSFMYDRSKKSEEDLKASVNVKLEEGNRYAEEYIKYLENTNQQITKKSFNDFLSSYSSLSGTKDLNKILEGIYNKYDDPNSKPLKALVEKETAKDSFMKDLMELKKQVFEMETSAEDQKSLIKMFNSQYGTAFVTQQDVLNHLAKQGTKLDIISDNTGTMSDGIKKQAIEAKAAVWETHNGQMVEVKKGSASTRKIIDSNEELLNTLKLYLEADEKEKVKVVEVLEKLLNITKNQTDVSVEIKSALKE